MVAEGQATNSRTVAVRGGDPKIRSNLCNRPRRVWKNLFSCRNSVELACGDVRKIVLVRPAVEAGENLGFYLGTYEQNSIPTCVH